MKKKKKRKKKKKSKEETEDNQGWAWVDRQKYVERRTSWMWRLRPYLKERHIECKTCMFNSRCQRIPVNEKITAGIAKGKKCPDYKSVWKKILNEEESYDWGF